MRQLRPLLLLSLVAFLFVPAQALAATTGCRGTSGSAAIEQYCETLPTAGGGVDVTSKPAVPLARVLPKGVVRRLERAGPLGQMLLALPAGYAGSNGPGSAAAHRAASDSRLKELVPEPAASPTAVVQAGLRGPDREAALPLAWALLVVLFFLGGASLGRLYGKMSARGL